MNNFNILNNFENITQFIENEEKYKFSNGFLYRYHLDQQIKYINIKDLFLQKNEMHNSSL